MQPSKTTLLGLSRKLDANQGISCLNSLSNESTDPDFEQVLEELLQGIVSIRPADFDNNTDAFNNAIDRLASKMGAEGYVTAVARLNHCRLKPADSLPD